MDNLDILFQVTCCLTNSELRSFGEAGAWSFLLQLASNQEWWYRRTEWLVQKKLEWRAGDWSTVYKSLLEQGLVFGPRPNYGSTLLISVLLEIGADPSQHGSYCLSQACLSDNLEGVRLLLADGRADPEDGSDYCLLYAVENENRDMIKLLLDDGRENPNSCFCEAVETGDEVIVAMLIADKRVNPN